MYIVITSRELHKSIIFGCKAVLVSFNGKQVSVDQFDILLLGFYFPQTIYIYNFGCNLIGSIPIAKNLYDTME